MQGISQVPKTAKMGTFEGVLVIGLHYSSNGTISGNGNHFGDSRHPKDVPFVSEFLYGGRTMWAI